MKDSKQNDKEFLLYPVLLSTFGIVIESIAGYFQDEVRITYKPTSFQFMFCTNFYIGILSSVLGRHT